LGAFSCIEPTASSNRMRASADLAGTNAELGDEQAKVKARNKEPADVL